MTHFDTTRTMPRAATRQSFRNKPCRDLVAEIAAENPQASHETWRKRYIARCREDEDYLLASLDYAFDNALAAYLRVPPRSTAEKKAATAKRKAEEASAHAKLVADIKVKVLLDLKMPNGKPLRDCTGGECAHFGGWLGRLAARVGADKQVGDVLSEAQVREIYGEA
jgi:hypothetical protein